MPMLRLLPPLHDPQMMDIIAVHLLRDPSLEGKDREAECVKVIFSLKGSHTYIFFPIFWFWGAESHSPRHSIPYRSGVATSPRTQTPPFSIEKHFVLQPTLFASSIPFDGYPSHSQHTSLWGQTPTHHARAHFHQLPTQRAWYYRASARKVNAA